MSGGLEDLLIDAKTMKNKEFIDENNDFRIIQENPKGSVKDSLNNSFSDLPEFNNGLNGFKNSIGIDGLNGFNGPNNLSSSNGITDPNGFDSLTGPNGLTSSNGINALIGSNVIYETNDDSEEFLSDILQDLRSKIMIVGVGGAGNNAISRLQDVGVNNAVTIAINTDAQDLFYSNSDKKLLIGKKVTQGLGAGNDYITGEKAAESDLVRLRSILTGNVVFIACGLGGGTGTGAAPIIAKTAKEQGALVISFCTLPFNMEGNEKRMIALKGLKKLAKYSDTIIPLPNEKLIKLIPNISLIKGFKVMDEILIRSIKGIVDLISTCGLVNLDLADVKNVLKKRENVSGFIGISEVSLKKLEEFESLSLKSPQSSQQSQSSQHPQYSIWSKSPQHNGENTSDNESLVSSMDLLKERTIKALSNPILEFDPKKINACLVSISGSQNLTLTQIDCIVRTVSDNIAPNAKIKFGTIIEPNSKTIKINIIGQGDVSPYLLEANRI